MSTCEENDDLINIFNLISNIKEDLKKLKSLDIPTDEIRITELKVKCLSSFNFKIYKRSKSYRILSTQRW